MAPYKKNLCEVFILNRAKPGLFLLSFKVEITEQLIILIKIKSNNPR